MDGLKNRNLDYINETRVNLIFHFIVPSKRTKGSKFNALIIYKNSYLRKQNEVYFLAALLYVEDQPTIRISHILKPKFYYKHIPKKNFNQLTIQRQLLNK